MVKGQYSQVHNMNNSSNKEQIISYLLRKLRQLFAAIYLFTLKGQVDFNRLIKYYCNTKDGGAVGSDRIQADSSTIYIQGKYANENRRSCQNEDYVRSDGLGIRYGRVFWSIKRAKL